MELECEGKANGRNWQNNMKTRIKSSCHGNKT